MRRCPKCQAEGPEGMSICRHCGSILEDVDAAKDVDSVVDEAEATSAIKALPETEESARAEDPDEAATSGDWTCATCSERLPEGFEVCWNCGTDRQGVVAPDFVRAVDSRDSSASPMDDASSDEGLSTPAGDDEFASAPAPAGSGHCVCLDCGGRTRPIQLIDSTGQDRAHEDLKYAASDAERGRFLSRFPVAGVIRAMMCPDCGHVSLYAEPKT